MNVFLSQTGFAPSQFLNSSAAQAVVQIIRQALPDGEITNIVPVVGLGVSGEAQLFRFDHNNGHPKPLIAKIGNTVGINERRGRKLLIDYLPLALAVEDNQPDLFIYEFIPGLPLHYLLYENYPAAEKHLQSFIQANIRMWQWTLERGAATQLIGYPNKLDSTLSLALNFPLDSQLLADLVDLPVVVNSKPLPSFNQCFFLARQLIFSGSNVSVLQHGDEGASNFIVQDGDQRHFFIDNGAAGQRLLAEGVAKIIMWWAVTAPSASVEFEVRSNHLVFNYKLDLPQSVFRPINHVINNILTQLKDHLDYRQLAACLGIYCLREIQWAKKRGNNLNSALLAMAFSAFAGMFDNWLYFPGFDSERG